MSREVRDETAAAMTIDRTMPNDPRGPAPQAGEAATDGRRRRSHTSQRRIVAAMIALVGEGHLTPSAELVAERAEVGLRTVFRQFKDMDSLYREMQTGLETVMGSMLDVPFVAGDWRGQILEMVERRAMRFERLAPYLRASQVRRHRSTALREGHDHFVALLRRILLARLPTPDALDPAMLDALDLLLSFEAWSRLRDEQRLDVEQAKLVLANTIGRLLESATARSPDQWRRPVART